MRRSSALCAAILVLASGRAALAEDFPYRRDVTLSVGESVVLKGRRDNNCSTTDAPPWNHIASGLPESGLGTFSDGGEGTVRSDTCGGTVAARGIRFTATGAGTETFDLFGDTIKITVE